MKNEIEALRKHGAIWAVFIAMCFLCFWPSLRGRELIPYDFTTDMYPWTVYSVSMARESIFRTVNEFKLGGIPGLNFIAYFDPLYIPALFRGQLPATFIQKIVLLHYLLIPLALSIWLNERRRAIGWLSTHSIVCLSLALACLGICGPMLRHFQHSNATEAYWWGIAAVILLDSYFFKRSLLVLLLAAASFCWAFMRFPTSSVHWPFFILPVFLFRAFVNVKQPLREATVKHTLAACVLSFFIIIPCAMQSQHLFEIITLSKNIMYLDDIYEPDFLAPFGANLPVLSLILCPLLLITFALSGFRTLGRKAFLLIVAVLVVASLFALGSRTTFAEIFRTFYPPASLFRRPYAILYVLFAFLSSGLLLYWSNNDTPEFLPEGKIQRKFNSLALCAVAGCALVLFSSIKFEISVPLAVAISLGSVALAQFRNWTLPALFVSWVAIVWLPFKSSQWSPHADDTGALSQYSNSENWLHGAPTAKQVMRESFVDGEYKYRVFSIGMPADYGGFAGMMPFMNVAPDYGTLFPAKLNSHLHFDDSVAMHATHIGEAVDKQGWAQLESPLDELSVRFLLLDPTSFTNYRPYFLAHPDKYRLRSETEYYRVVERLGARPFGRLTFPNGTERPVRIVRTAGGFAVADAAVCQGGPTELRVSLIADSWWTPSSPSMGKQIADRTLLSHPVACAEQNSSTQINFDHTKSGFSAFVSAAVAAWVLVAAAFVLHLVRMCVLTIPFLGGAAERITVQKDRRFETSRPKCGCSRH